MDWLKELLGEELYNQVVGKLGDVKLLKDDGTMVPKDQLEKANEKIKGLDADVGKLNARIKEQEGLSQKLSDKDAEIGKVKKEGAIILALAKAKAKDENLVKTLLKQDTIELLEDGTIKGLDDQLKGLKESHAYLFSNDDRIDTGAAGNFGRQDNKTEITSLSDAVAEHYKSAQ